jgi:hypothetical protein
MRDRLYQQAREIMSGMLDVMAGLVARSRSRSREYAYLASLVERDGGRESSLSQRLMCLAHDVKDTEQLELENARILQQEQGAFSTEHSV